MAAKPCAGCLALVGVLVIAHSLAGASAAPLCNTALYASANQTTLIASGKEVPFANGTVSTYVRLADDDGCGAPLAVGVRLAVDRENMPDSAEVTVQPPPGCEGPLSPVCPPPFDTANLAFPGGNTSLLPFTFMGLYWNPLGHEPIGTFSKPHFDLHFNMITEAQNAEIAAGTPPDICAGMTPAAFTAANEPILQDCFPSNAGGAKYFNDLLVVPFMGNHYIDMNAPEIKALAAGDPDPSSKWVTPSWIYGGYNGSLIFMEPMTPLALLLAIQQNATRRCWPAAGLPKEFAQASNYPTQYCIDGREPGVIKVELEKFKAFPAGCNGTEYAAASYSTAALPPAADMPPFPAVCVAPKAATAGAPVAAPPSKAPTTTPSTAPGPSSAAASTAASSICTSILLAASLFW